MINKLFGGWELRDATVTIGFSSLFVEATYYNYFDIVGSVNGVLVHTKTGDRIVLKDSFFKDTIHKGINLERFQKECINLVNNERELNRRMNKVIKDWMKYRIREKTKRGETTDSQAFNELLNQKITVRLDNLKIK